jgi:hypothetical protein
MFGRWADPPNFSAFAVSNFAKETAMDTRDKSIVSWVALLGYAVVCGLLVMETVGR